MVKGTGVLSEAFKAQQKTDLKEDKLSTSFDTYPDIKNEIESTVVLSPTVKIQSNNVQTNYVPSEREKKLKNLSDAFVEKFRKGDAVTLFDSKPFLDYMAYKAINGGIPYRESLKNQVILDQLKTYFATTHQ